MFSDLVDTNCGPCGIWRVSPKKAQPLHRNEPSPTKLMFSVEHHPRNGSPKIPNNPKHNLTLRVVFDVLLDSQQFMMPFLGFKLAATEQ